MAGPPCAKAEFDVVGHGWFGGETIGLTQLTVSQNVEVYQAMRMADFLIKEYGEPRVRPRTRLHVCN
jgi:hypothetical protein